MPVEITNELSLEMQELADHRDHVRKMEAGVEYAKGELKTAKELLEAAQTSMNEAIDKAIEAARQPTLFDRFGGDDLGDVSGSATPPGDGGSGGGTLVFDRIPAGPVEGVPGLFALPAGPAWRNYTLTGVGFAEAVSTTAMDFLTVAGIETCGELADQLVAGKTFGLAAADLYDVQHQIERLSANSTTPLVFNRGDAAGTLAPDCYDPTAAAASEGGSVRRESFPADRSGKWEFMAAAFFHVRADGVPPHQADSAAEYRRLKDQIADHRAILDIAGKINPVWGSWSEFTITLRGADATGVPCEVLYKPGWHSHPGRDHVELWSPCLAPKGFWSFEENHPVQDGQVNYPTAYELEDRVTQLAQEQADAWAKEQKAAERKAKKQKKGA